MQVSSSRMLSRLINANRPAFIYVHLASVGKLPLRVPSQSTLIVFL